LSNSNLQIEKQELFRALRFTIERVTQQLPSGQQVARDIVRHPGAVVILPLLEDGRICLIRNFRVSVEQELLELPAGTLEPGEPPAATAARELIEETGYCAGQITPLCEFYMSPGILDERMVAFVATDLTAGSPAREVGEQIDNCLLTLEEIDQLLRNGEIKDSKSISTLLYFMRYHIK
jgi:ADP-ribose pyrophosphatase